MHKTPDIELIAQSKQGDQAALAELFGRHYPASLRLARGMLRSEAESQDAVQVAYLSAFRHLHKFRGDACFKTWITRIVVNCCLMQLREPGKRFAWLTLEDMRGAHVQEVLTCPAPSPEKAAWRQEMARAVSDAVAKLPKHLREVFALYSVSGLSLREVAAKLGLTVPATKTRLFRARDRMRLRLAPVWSNARPHGAPAVFRAPRVN